jgi:hypothetical protein
MASTEGATCLHYLLAIVPEPLLAIGHGGPMHRGPQVNDLLAEFGPAPRRGASWPVTPWT